MLELDLICPQTFVQDSCNVKVFSSVCKYNSLIASLESFHQINLQDLQQYTFSLKSICNFSSEACNSSLIRTPLSVFLLTLLLNILLQLGVFRSHLEGYKVVTCHRNCGSLNKVPLSRSPKYLTFPLLFQSHQTFRPIRKNHISWYPHPRKDCFSSFLKFPVTSNWSSAHKPHIQRRVSEIWLEI